MIDRWLYTRLQIAREVCGGLISLTMCWISVFVTIAGYVECLGEQEGYGRIRFYRFKLL